MGTNIFKAFKQGTLNEELILRETLTMFGARMYPHLKIAEQANRKAEVACFTKMRDNIFYIRDNCKPLVSNKTIMVARLQVVGGAMDGISAALVGISGREWEGSAIRQICNVLKKFIYQVNEYGDKS